MKTGYHRAVWTAFAVALGLVLYLLSVGPVTWGFLTIADRWCPNSFATVHAIAAGYEGPADIATTLLPAKMRIAFLEYVAWWRMLAIGDKFIFIDREWFY